MRAAGAMSAMTALSRIAGYVRDRVQAELLGAGYSSDAFVIAFRIPNLLRRLVAEGALTSAFVPTFARYMQAKDEDRMWRFAGSVFFCLAALLTVIVVLGVILSPLLVHALAWGYSDQPGKIALTVQLNRWMWPYIFFISLSALSAGVLNAFGIFALPASTPILLNLAIIACALAFRNRFSDPAYAFAVGVLIGGFLQFVVQLPALFRLGFRLRPPIPLDQGGVREVGRLMMPRVFGVGVTQFNLVVDSQFATSLRTGSASYLYYANRITELTLGIFGISLSTVILPSLSRAAVEKDRDRVLETLATAMRLLIFITVPATIGLVILRIPIIHVLFEHGHFTAEDTLLTASALACYSVGMLPFAAVNVLATAFYAHRDTRTPVKVGLVTFFLHLGLNFALRAPLQHSGIALSTSLCAFFDAGMLAWILRRRHGEFLGSGVRRCAVRTLLASGAMAAVLLLLMPFSDPAGFAHMIAKASALGGLIAAGGVAYLAVATLIGSEEIGLLRSLFRLGPPRPPS